MFCSSTHRPPGLFAQAIIQSGSPLAFWAVHDDKVDLDSYVRELAGHVMCNAELINDVVNCLRSVDWQRFTAAANCRVRNILGVFRIGVFGY